MELQPNPHASKISPGIFYYYSTFYELRPWSRTASRNCTAAKEKKRESRCIGASVGRTEPPPIPLCFWDLMRRIRLSRDGVGVTSAGCCSLCTCRPGCRASPAATGTSRLRPAGHGTDVAAVATGHAAAVTPGQRHRRPAGARTSVCVGGVERRPSQSHGSRFQFFDVLSRSVGRLLPRRYGFRAPVLWIVGSM